MTSTLTISRLTKRFQTVEALAEVSLDLGPGMRVALLGHNGAGKSTMMKIILGLIPFDAGEVRVCGAAPGSAQARMQVAYLPENAAFHPALTGEEQIRHYLSLRGESPRRAMELLERVGLAKAARRRIGTYSKGMRQRLGMAQALLGDPELVLLDEPTSGLDPNSRLQVYQTIEALKARGKSILVSTHALTEIEAHADKVVLIHEGRVLAAGTLQGLRDGARLPTVARLTVREGWEAEGLTAAGTGIHLDRQADKVTVAVPQGGMSAFLDMLARMRPWVAEVEIAPPTLDRLYQHLLAEAGSAR
jgi:Cu-processing system ATP-binding protein